MADLLTLREEVQAKAGISSPVRTLNRLLVTGQFAQEIVPCFCGSTSGKVLTRHDRYGVHYQAVLCPDCGLIYANPRMTDDALLQFYRDHYRQIFVDLSEEEDRARLRDCGKELQGFLADHFGFAPSCVLDIGCHTGEMVEAFATAGATVAGVEIGELWPEVQPDLVILHHVLEHFTDLEGHLLKIREMLSDHGQIYIGVPGTFKWKKDDLWQCAHTYQFCLDTLEYVMECCGFREVYCTEDIFSLWEKSEVFRPKSDRPSGVAYRTDLCLQGKPFPAPEMRTYNKFTHKTRKANIAYSLSLHRPDIGELRGTCRRACIVGGGPSVDDHLDEIRALVQGRADLFCIERMLQWGVERDLTPTYVVCVDASEDVVESFRDPPTEPVYLLAAQVRPQVWDLLKNRRAFIFNGPQPDIDLPFLWDEYGYDEVCMVNTAGCVTLSALSIALTMGATEIDLFGFDCHLIDRPYAQGITGAGMKHRPIPVTIGDRSFITTQAFMSFVNDFFIMEGLAKKQGLTRLTVHGDSVVNALKEAEAHQAEVTKGAESTLRVV